MINVPLGRVVYTPGAQAELSVTEIMAALKRHATGDWGDLDKHDKRANDAAAKHGDRILSAYKSEKGNKFWIITEWDRSVTTILLPDEY